MQIGGAPRGVLLTGATGFLGKLMLGELLRRRDALGVGPIYALVRPQAGVTATRRFRRSVERAACMAQLPDGWARDVRVVEGDLSAPGCGLAPADAEALRADVTHVAHAAAAVDFDLPLAEAAAANVTATLGVLDLARACPRLARLVAVSTAYVTPHPGAGSPVEETLAPLPDDAEALYAAILAGRADERALLARSGHPNTYTFTKCLSEHLLVARGADLPIRIVRPSIISATWRRPFPSWIDSPAAFAAFVALIGSGYLRAVVGDPETRLNLVPADWVAEQVLDTTFAPAPPPVQLAVAAPHHAPSLRECREAIVGFYRANPAGRRATVRYLGPSGPLFRVADRLHNQAPVRLAMLVSSRARGRGQRLLARLDATNRLFPYFTQRTFDFRASSPFDDPGFDRRAYVSLVCEGVARYLLRKPPAPAHAGAPAGPPA